MDFRITIVTGIAKAARFLTRLRGRGGSAFPGLVAEKLAPDYLAKTLGSLPEGVIIITGTNGKTTTTKMVADLLTNLGKTVLTNSTGSNFTRGIAATIVQQSRLGRRLPHDIAIIELDEAYAKRFVQIVKPRFVVALNVIRDQLDRFGEVDATARLLETVMAAATEANIVNGDDPRLVEVAEKLKIPAHYYTVNPRIRAEFPTDEELLSVRAGRIKHKTHVASSDVQLESFDGRSVSYRLEDTVHETMLNVTGQYNFQNAAAAIALARLIVPDIATPAILKALAAVTPAFGRGETMVIHGQPLEILLVKNPAGFRSSLRSFTTPADTMIAINDNDADGRDVSWLWDVNFDNLPNVAMVSGTRAYDMALRLQYDGVSFAAVDSDLLVALRRFISGSPDRPKRIFCTYTAMLPLHAELSKLSGQERAL